MIDWYFGAPRRAFALIFAACVEFGLIVGKVVLIADALPFINKFPGKPLIYNVAWKTLVYVLAAFLVRLVENLIPLIIKYDSFREAMARIEDDIVWPHFWIIYIWLSVLLFVYCSLRELIRAIGREHVLKLFFGIGRPESMDGAGERAG